MLDKEYRELTDIQSLSGRNSRSISDVQRRRQLEMEELPAHDWDTKREALKASGLVAERARLFKAGLLTNQE